MKKNNDEKITLYSFKMLLGEKGITCEGEFDKTFQDKMTLNQLEKVIKKQIRVSDLIAKYFNKKFKGFECKKEH